MGCKVPSISELCDWLKDECWSSLSLSTLLPVSASALTRAELNPLLGWSFGSWGVQEQPTLALLVGMLEASPSTATLQLRDQSGALDCVLVDTHAKSGRQQPADNTAWLGKTQLSNLTDAFGHIAVPSAHLITSSSLT